MTLGISPKAILAAILPTLGGIVAVLIQWVATGEFSRAELATALSAVSASLLAFIGAYLGDPGDVAIEVGPASDALMPAAALSTAESASPTNPGA